MCVATVKCVISMSVINVLCHYVADAQVPSTRRTRSGRVPTQQPKAGRAGRKRKPGADDKSSSKQGIQ